MAFKVNFEEYDDELYLFFDFAKRNKNNLKVIYNNKIISIENLLITKKSKIKFILLDNHYFYQPYQMKYIIKVKKILMNFPKGKIKIFGREFVKKIFLKA